MDPSQRPNVLTPREKEILTLLGQGLVGKQVAFELGVSTETVRAHVRNARCKLGARTRMHALALALSMGEISL